MIKSQRKCTWLFFTIILLFFTGCWPKDARLSAHWYRQVQLMNDQRLLGDYVWRIARFTEDSSEEIYLFFRGDLEWNDCHEERMQDRIIDFTDCGCSAVPVIDMNNNSMICYATMSEIDKYIAERRTPILNIRLYVNETEESLGEYDQILSLLTDRKWTRHRELQSVLIAP